MGSNPLPQPRSPQPGMVLSVELHLPAPRTLVLNLSGSFGDSIDTAVTTAARSQPVRFVAQSRNLCELRCRTPQDPFAFSKMASSGFNPPSNGTNGRLGHTSSSNRPPTAFGASHLRAPTYTPTALRVPTPARYMLERRLEETPREADWTKSLAARKVAVLGLAGSQMTLKVS